jgi:hypothetical protein
MIEEKSLFSLDNPFVSGGRCAAQSGQTRKRTSQKIPILFIDIYFTQMRFFLQRIAYFETLFYYSYVTEDETMKKLPFFLVLALKLFPAGELPDFAINDVLVLPDGFIALKIENSSLRDYALPPASRERIFLSLAINGVKRAEYKIKSVDPIIFLKSSFIVFKTNFRVSQPLRIRVEVNGERAVPESDLGNNVLEKDLRPPF